MKRRLCIAIASLLAVGASAPNRAHARGLPQQNGCIGQPCSTAEYCVRIGCYYCNVLGKCAND
jgi:hypothetical protein